MRHTDRPLAASSRVTDPSAAAANTLSFALAGENAKASELPIEVDHAVRTARVGVNSTNAAGGLRGGGLLLNGFNPDKAEHPARTSVVVKYVSFAAIRIFFPFA
jgi:hypothetical protein